MVERVCKLGDDCRKTKAFSVRYPSDPKEYCSPTCQGVGMARRRAANGTSAAGAMARAAQLRKRVAPALKFIEGMAPLDIFREGVRLGYERHRRERENEPLGAIGPITQEALAE